jgi:hypothetical protein
MRTPPAKIRHQLLAKLHIAFKQIGIDEDTHRAMLERITGGRSDSAADMTIAELEAAVEELTRKGFRPAPPRDKTDDFIEFDPKDPATRHLKKLTACWFDLIRIGAIQTKSAKRSLRKFIKKLTGVDDLRWLTPQQCNSVIEACKGWKRKFLVRHPTAESAPTAPTIPANAIVKAGVFDAMRLVGEARGPIDGIRNVLVLLDSQNFSDAKIAAQVAELIREFGERARQALLRWDYRKVRSELLWLVGRVAEIDLSIAEGMRATLKAEDGETETAIASARSQNKNTRGDSL